ncbi:hypothetical protein DFJ74DRAFT_687878 [Hyaloraphidium curvatum]|nr:hypothetical protein DFJ74DRAFT_687878 [Hyaloraphidium curvatum]
MWSGRSCPSWDAHFPRPRRPNPHRPRRAARPSPSCFPSSKRGCRKHPRSCSMRPRCTRRSGPREPRSTVPFRTPRAWAPRTSGLRSPLPSPPARTSSHPGEPRSRCRTVLRRPCVRTSPCGGAPRPYLPSPAPGAASTRPRSCTPRPGARSWTQCGTARTMSSWSPCAPARCRRTRRRSPPCWRRPPPRVRRGFRSCFRGGHRSLLRPPKPFRPCRRPCLPQGQPRWRRPRRRTNSPTNSPLPLRPLRSLGACLLLWSARSAWRKRSASRAWCAAAASHRSRRTGA